MKPFPDCNIYYMPQRSDEWFDVRRGVLTATQFGAWLLPSKSGKPTKTQTEAKRKTIFTLMAEYLDQPSPPMHESWHMKRGNILEPQSVNAFEFDTGKSICPVGFCKSQKGAFGCSPDGLIFDDGHGFETKSPDPSTHLRYHDEGVLPDQYKFQVHGSMAVCGASGWWFQSFCPELEERLPECVSFRIFVERDQFTEDLLAALVVFSDDYKEAMEKKGLSI